MIDRSLSMKEIESALKADILVREQEGALKILGDLKLSEEEYSVLTEKLQEVFAQSSHTLKGILKAYPVSLAAAAVFMAKYRYDRNFWGAFARELGTEFAPLQQTEVGRSCLEVFQSFGLTYDDAVMVHTYLDPICYEAGVPTAGSLDGLFYAVKYDAGHSFDPLQIIEELLDERTYGVRKTLKRYLQHFREDRAIDCLLEIHEAILAVDQGIPGDSWYLRSYSDWLQRDRENTAKTKKDRGDVTAKPYLVFDERYGLSLQMPKVLLEREWVEKPKWTVLCGEDGREIQRAMRVYDDYGRRRIAETRIPVSVADRYTVYLTDDEAPENEAELLEPWEINGVQAGCVLFFNANGRMIAPRFLPYPHAVLLLADENAQITESFRLEEDELFYPLLEESPARAISVTPMDGRSRLKVRSHGEELSLEARPRIDITFDGERLFQWEDESSLPVFTSLPVLHLDADESGGEEDFEVRCGQTVLALEPCGDESENKKHYAVDLSLYSEKCFPTFGVYSIRVYKHELFLKSVDFGYAPFVDTTYDPRLSLARGGNSGGVRTLEFDFGKALAENPDLDISLDFGGSPVKRSGAHCSVECPVLRSVLQGTLIVENSAAGSMRSLSFPFALPLRPFDVTVLKPDNTPAERQPDAAACRLSLEEICGETYWILLDAYGEYAHREYSLRLHTADGYVQSEKLKRNSAAGFTCSLSAFTATLQNCPLPARLELFVSGEEEFPVPVAAVSREAQLGARPVHSYSGDGSQVYFRLDADKGKDLILTSFSAPDRRITLAHADSTTAKTKKGTELRVFSLPKLQPGFYAVSVGEKEEDPFGFEEEFGTALSNGSDTLYVTSVPKRSSFPSFSAWLDSLMTDILAAGQQKGLDEKETYQEVLKGGLVRWSGAELTEADRTNLVALVWFSQDKRCCKEKIWHLRRCMSEISCQVLNARSRAALARQMLAMHCPGRLIRSAIHTYDFFLMDHSCEDAVILAEQLAPYSEELSLILTMAQNPPMREVFSERALRTLGREALLQMMEVPGEEDPAALALEQKKFLRGQKGARVAVKLPPELAGKEEWIEPMIVYEKDRIRLDLEKMPKEGIPFDGIRFTELCANWFRIRLNKDTGSKAVELLDPEFEAVMNRAVQEDCAKLMRCYKAAGSDPVSGRVQKRYQRGIRLRYTKDPTLNLSTGIPMRFFYVQAVAAFLVLMPERYHPGPEAKQTAQHFLSMAARVASRMVRRDLTMAETFYYLIGKEEELCQ